jgi:hypothetical protein
MDKCLTEKVKITKKVMSNSEGASQQEYINKMVDPLGRKGTNMKILWGKGHHKLLFHKQIKVLLTKEESQRQKGIETRDAMLYPTPRRIPNRKSVQCEGQ